MYTPIVFSNDFPSPEDVQIILGTNKHNTIDKTNFILRQ